MPTAFSMIDALPSTITIDVDPVLHLGGLAIHWYGVMYVLAFAAGYRFAVRPYLERRGISREESERMTGWVIVFGLIGARLFYVVQSSPPQGGSWLRHPAEIFAVWHGGMAFFGAIIAGFATIAWLAWRRGRSVWLIADAGVLFAVVGQPIGRIGNLINGDILGSPSSLPWATAYANPNAVLQSGFYNCHDAVTRHVACIDPVRNVPAFYQPAAAYEAIATILIGVVLVLLIRRHVRHGVVAIAYVALYAVSQIIVFEFRDSEPVVGLGLKQAQWTSIVILVVALPVLVLAWRRGLGDFTSRQRGTIDDDEPEPAAQPGDASALTASSGTREAANPR